MHEHGGAGLLWQQWNNIRSTAVFFSFHKRYRKQQRHGGQFVVAGCFLQQFVGKPREIRVRSGPARPGRSGRGWKRPFGGPGRWKDWKYSQDHAWPRIADADRPATHGRGHVHLSSGRLFTRYQSSSSTPRKSIEDWNRCADSAGLTSTVPRWLKDVSSLLLPGWNRGFCTRVWQHPRRGNYKV